MSSTSQMNGANGMDKKRESFVEIPAPVQLQGSASNGTRTKNEGLPSRSSRSAWFSNIFGPLGKYGKLRKAQFVLGARNVEVMMYKAK